MWIIECIILLIKGCCVHQQVLLLVNHVAYALFFFFFNFQQSWGLGLTCIPFLFSSQPVQIFFSILNGIKLLLFTLENMKLFPFVQLGNPFYLL